MAERVKHNIILDFTSENMRMFVHCSECADHLIKYHLPMFKALVDMPGEPGECLLAPHIEEKYRGKVHKLSIPDLDAPQTLKSCCSNWLADFVGSKHFPVLQASLTKKNQLIDVVSQ